MGSRRVDQNQLLCSLGDTVEIRNHFQVSIFCYRHRNSYFRVHVPRQGKRRTLILSNMLIIGHLLVYKIPIFYQPDLPALIVSNSQNAVPWPALTRGTAHRF